MAYNILIVDDSAITRAVLARTIGICGVPVGEVYQAANGKEALVMLDENWIDIMFADINMPVIDGLQLVEELKKRSDWERLPVVICSTEGSSQRVEELKAAGIKGYIRKPFTAEQVSEIIHQVMEANHG